MPRLKQNQTIWPSVSVSHSESLSSSSSSSSSSSGSKLITGCFLASLAWLFFNPVTRYAMVDKTVEIAATTAASIAPYETASATVAAATAAANANTNKNSKQKVLVIASVPLDKDHSIALWSQLECFAGSFDHVVISTAYWSKTVVARIVEEARLTIPHFQSNNSNSNNNSNNNARVVTIEFVTYDNKKYDAGLWCDALMGIRHRYEQFALVNDSIFALKQYHNITDALGTINKFHNNRIIDNNNNNNNNTITTANKDGTSTTTGTSTSAANTTVSMTSLNFHENDDASFPWQESIFRAFDPYGLRVFMDHSCVPMEHESFCHGKAAVKKKRCIVDFHEIQVSPMVSQPGAAGLWDLSRDRSERLSGANQNEGAHRVGVQRPFLEGSVAPRGISGRESQLPPHVQRQHRRSAVGHLHTVFESVDDRHPGLFQSRQDHQLFPETLNETKRNETKRNETKRTTGRRVRGLSVNEVYRIVRG
eukprot:CAMPEP_0168230216 /NCGR_PEP_ID=MMETSP0140_2-20121125/15805_1 /TAXON_ID=44445 /ORGANISM="Pseudo-nitzschia australis, Strain 10249 10 AB" /LENGTH=478 /DNA_ID=CAMNT_0008162309 /DNA_START=21 /DNA_END=1458 /DNA_ORIENTATION=-